MPHEYTWRVTLQDVDQFEILFYSRVFEALQRGIESLFEAGGRTYHEIANDTDYNYPIVATSAEYSRQVPWGETVSLEITPTVGDTSFSFDAVGYIDGERAFDVERTQAVIDTQTNDIVSVPPELREPLEHVAE
jgi:acyl-CoA thioesterase FadM